MINTLRRLLVYVLLAALLVLAAGCSTAGALPEGSIPIVPPTKTAQVISPTAVAQLQPTVVPSQPTVAPVQVVAQPGELDAGAGALIYSQRCADCHGITGKGDGAQAAMIADQLGGQLPDFSDPAYARAATLAGWFDVVSQGRMQKGMPPFGSATQMGAGLSETERWNVVAYLFSLSTTTERIGQGQALYTANCAQCHQADGKGVSTADLTRADMVKLSQADLDKVIETGRGQMPAFSASLNLQERQAVADYVRSLSIGLPKTVAAGQAAIVTQLTNGTADADIPTDIELTLYALSANMETLIFTRTAQVDASGQARFDGLDAAPEVMYAVVAEYQGAFYYTDPQHFATGQPLLDLVLPVYETTADPSVIRVDRMHVILDVQPASIQVSQVLVVSNVGDRAFVDSDGLSLRVQVPSGAVGLNFDDGTLGERYVQTESGFADVEAIYPGEGARQILFSYVLPYDGQSLEVTLPTAYPVQNVNLLLPDVGLQLDSSQLTLVDSRPAQGMTYLNFGSETPLAAGQALSFRLSGAVTGVGGAAPAADNSLGLILGLVVVTGALVGGAFWWWRSRQAETMDEAEELDDQEEQSQDELLDEIAALDDAFEAGHLAEADYRREREELKAALMKVMGKE